MLSLSECKKGALCNIVGIAEGSSIKIKRRLCELGLFSGEKVKILQRSALGKVMLIEVRGYVLSLRVEQAKFLLVEGK